MSPPSRNRRRCTCRSASLDEQFDRLLPDELRHLSATHWTPVRAAVRAASLLTGSKRTRILDIGSGVGKVCAIGALSGQGTWVGVEQHPALVEPAAELARALGVADRTRFVQADAFSLDWTEFDALYLYNPFELPLFRDVPPGASLAEQTAQVQRRLAAMPSCARVVTLHGFGGTMPASYELLYHEVIPGVGLDLAMWIQRGHAVTWSAAS
ncbi:MAG: class I SAM-dependent methyltransferase [Myxococcales bacterium]|nr:class I SAM-dependent methyltransferase [Myxococcales bacterium]